MRATVGAAAVGSGITRRAGCTALFAALILGGVVPVAAQTQAEAQTQTHAEGFVGPNSFADLVNAKLPAVVNVSTTRHADVAENGGQGLPQLPPGSPFEEFFRDFFRHQFPEGQPPEPPMGEMMAVGSGFIIDPDGYVVTNNHVVAESEKVIVTLQDDTELTAKIVGTDPRTDLALLKVEAKEPLPYVEWGDSDAIQVGDWVMAVGNPFGLGGSVTTGIISARARDINAGPYDDFLQTDASINRGNSGGPLFDMKGRVIGVNTAIFSPSGGNIGIGFAVPSSLAKPVVAELREHGSVRRGWLGVSIQPVTDDIAEAVGLDKARGALVAQVLEGTPAAEAGLESGDVILTYNGKEIADPDELSRTVADTPVDETVEIGFLRGGKRQTADVTIALLQEREQVAEAEAAQPEPTETGTLGLKLAELSPELREEYGIPEEKKGVLVVDVAQDSAAADENIAPGDIITKVGQKEVSAPNDVVSAIEQARNDKQKSVLLLRERNGAPAFVALPTQPEQG
jgi:serine protease Do